MTEDQPTAYSGGDVTEPGLSPRRMAVVGTVEDLERKHMEEHIKDLRCTSSVLSERRMATVTELSQLTRNQGWAPLLNAASRVSAEQDKTSLEFISTRLETQGKMIEELKKQYLTLSRGVCELNSGLLAADDKADAIMDLMFKHGEAISIDRSHRSKSDRENAEHFSALKKKCKDIFVRLSDFEIRLASVKSETTSRSDNLAASLTSVKAELRGARNDMETVQEAHPEVSEEAELRLNMLEKKCKDVVQQVSQFDGRLSAVNAESTARTHENSTALGAFRTELRKVHVDMEMYVAEKCARMRDEVEKGPFGAEVAAKAEEAEEAERLWRDDAMREFKSRSKAALTDSLNAGLAEQAEALAAFERRACAAEHRQDERTEAMEEHFTRSRESVATLQAAQSRLATQARAWEGPVSTLRTNVDELMCRVAAPQIPKDPGQESAPTPKARSRRHHTVLGASRNVRAISRGFSAKGSPSGDEDPPPMAQRVVTSPSAGTAAHNRPLSSRSTSSNMRPSGQEPRAAEVRTGVEVSGDVEVNATQLRPASATTREPDSPTQRRPFSAASHSHGRPHVHVLGR